MRRLTAGLAVAAVLAGCAVGPNYQRPSTPLDSHFVNAGEPGFTQDDSVERYWTTFSDPLLDSLVDDALAHNKDLGTAAANLRVARAARRLAGFDLFPTVTFAGGYSKNLDSAQQLPGVDLHDREFDTADAGFDGLWELDLFGRVRRNVEAARADVGEAAATLQDARVSVIAELSRDYFVLRGLQDQLALTKRNADSQFNTLKLTRVRLEGGPRQSARHRTRGGSVADHGRVDSITGGIDRHYDLSTERVDGATTGRTHRRPRGQASPRLADAERHWNTGAVVTASSGHSSGRTAPGRRDRPRRGSRWGISSHG